MRDASVHYSDLEVILIPVTPNTQNEKRVLIIIYNQMPDEAVL